MVGANGAAVYLFHATDYCRQIPTPSSHFHLSDIANSGLGMKSRPPIDYPVGCLDSRRLGRPSGGLYDLAPGQTSE